MINPFMETEACAISFVQSWHMSLLQGYKLAGCGTDFSCQHSVEGGEAARTL
jgi:hypothetical protein